MAESRKLKTPVFRLSWPSLFVPTAFEEGSKKKYMITCIVPKDFKSSDYPDPKADNSQRMKLLVTEAERVGRECFGKDWERVKKLPNAWPFHDGEDKADKDGFGSDVLYFRAKSDNRPGVVNKKLQPLDKEDVYAGCYAIASVNVFAYTKGSKGVAIGLNNVMIVADGEPFDGRTRPEDDFEALDDMDEDGVDPLA